MDNKKWLVYKHTFPNCKVYYGITSRSENDRWMDGKGYSANHDMFNDIIKYGWDNIKHEIIADGLDENSARELEKTLIVSATKGKTYNTVYASFQNEYISGNCTIYQLCGDIPYKTYEKITETCGYAPYYLKIYENKVVAYCASCVRYGLVKYINMEAYYPDGKILKKDFMEWLKNAEWTEC